MWRLTHTKQCVNCPWKKSVDLSHIPNYSFKQHQKLQKTIANLSPLEQL